MWFGVSQINKSTSLIRPPCARSLNLPSVAWLSLTSASISSSSSNVGAAAVLSLPGDHGCRGICRNCVGAEGETPPKCQKPPAKAAAAEPPGSSNAAPRSTEAQRSSAVSSDRQKQEKQTHPPSLSQSYTSTLMLLERQDGKSPSKEARWDPEDSKGGNNRFKIRPRAPKRASESGLAWQLLDRPLSPHVNNTVTFCLASVPHTFRQADALHPLRYYWQKFTCVSFRREGLSAGCAQNT